MENYEECPICGGPCSPMGDLGGYHYDKCRDCGMILSFRIDLDPLDFVKEEKENADQA